MSNTCERVHVTVWSPLPICIAYDKDGTRADRCQTIVPPRGDIEPGTNACPRWILPNVGGTGPYRVVGAEDLLDPLLANGWSQLTRAEQLSLLGYSRNERTRLAIYIRLVTDDPRGAIPWEAGIVTRFVKLVPRDLEPAFDAFVETRFAKRACKIALDAQPSWASIRRREPAYVLRLAARVGDPQIANKLAPLAAREHDLPDRFRYLLEAALPVAIRRDPAVADHLADELAATTDQSRADELISALAATPSIVDVFAHNPQRLGHLSSWSQRKLFANVCDADARSVLAPIALPEVIREVDACIAEKAQLEPLFRQWLHSGPKRKAR